MNRDLIAGYIQQPLKVQAGAALDLAGLVKRYPYFQGAYMLLARAYKTGNDTRFEEALKDAAVNCADRVRLYEIVHQNETVQTLETPIAPLVEANVTPLPVEPEKPEITVQVVQTLEVPHVDEHKTSLVDELVTEIPADHEEHLLEEILVYPLIERTTESVESTTTNNQASEEAHSFFEWLNLLAVNQPETQARPATPIIDQPEKSRAELIDQFIIADPKISRPVKTEFFSPIAMARKSMEDDDEIVSETLARIYAEQGEKARAIRIYEKLSLQNPAKSRYFAALIENLEN